MSHQTVPQTDQRTVALADIHVEEGFNPRDRFEQRQLDELAKSIELHGLLQPLVLTLYLQGLRGWSAIETGLAIFPAGVLVALLAPRLAPLITRFGVTRLILAGLLSTVAAYALFLPIGADSGYLTAMLPTFLLGGLGFGLAYGSLNVAATNGIGPEEQGLAGGLLNTSFQFGGALALPSPRPCSTQRAAATGPSRECSTASTPRSSSR